jgi:hypothetical protein
VRTVRPPQDAARTPAIVRTTAKLCKGLIP